MSDYDIIVYIQPALMNNMHNMIGGAVDMTDLYRYLRTKTATHCVTQVMWKPDLNLFTTFYFWWNAKMNNVNTSRKGQWFSGALALRKERDGMYIGYLLGDADSPFAYGLAQDFAKAQRRAESTLTANFDIPKLLDEIMYGKVPNHPIISIDIHVENGQMILDEGQLESVA